MVHIATILLAVKVGEQYLIVDSDLESKCKGQNMSVMQFSQTLQCYEQISQKRMWNYSTS